MSSFYSLLNKLITKQVMCELYPNNKGMRTVLDEWTLLVEGRLEDAKKKFLVAAPYLDFFKDVPGKYIFWIALQIQKNGYGSKQDLQDLKDTVKKFDELVDSNRISKKDINQYPNVQELDMVVTQVGSTVSNTQQKKNTKGEARIVYKNERFTVVQPLTQAASCMYGKETRWCISAKEDNAWDGYTTEKGTGKPTGIQFYFIMDKTPTHDDWGKVAVVSSASLLETEIFDADDNEIRLKKFQAYYPVEVIEAISQASGNVGLAGKDAVFKKFMEMVVDPTTTEIQFRVGLAVIFSRIKHEDYDSNTTSYEKIVLEVPLRLLPLMYNLSGNNVYSLSLRNVGASEVFQQRLDGLSLDKVLVCVNKSYTTYSVKEPEDNWIEGDPYFEWIKYTKRRFSVEELRKLAKFVPEQFNDAPFKQRAIELYLAQVAPTLGIQQKHSYETEEDGMKAIDLINQDKINYKMIKDFLA